jgi:hypothetical protein
MNPIEKSAKLTKESKIVDKIVFIIWIISCLILIGFGIKGILYSYYYVETLEYVDVDFEWIDDFQNYEVNIIHEDKEHYLTVKERNVKFIYANEDFLNFVIVKHNKRIIDKKDWYGITSFYINLNYKEVNE